MQTHNTPKDIKGSRFTLAELPATDNVTLLNLPGPSVALQATPVSTKEWASAVLVH